MNVSVRQRLIHDRFTQIEDRLDELELQVGGFNRFLVGLGAVANVADEASRRFLDASIDDD